MAIFVAVAPPDGDAERTAFVRDGFTFWAFLVPVAWFLAHRMWIEAALALAATLLLGSLDSWGGAGGPLLSLLFGIVVGLEAPTLRLWALRRRGWTEGSVVEADNREDAEIRFFGEASDREQVAPSEPTAPAPAAPGPAFGRPAAPALGFLDYRGGA